MKRPRKASPVNRWRKWPQALAINETVMLYPWGNKTSWKHKTMLDMALECGEKLSERAKVKLEEVVVFYPLERYGTISRRLNRLKTSGEGLGKYKGLTISSTRKLEKACVAFLIKDVEEHRTPADAYYTNYHPGAVRANPIPLYDEYENFGKEVHE